MMLLPSYRFWEKCGGHSFENYRLRSYLEITRHANIRSRERNVCRDSVLALAEYAIQDSSIRNGNDEHVTVRYIGDTPEDSVIIPFGVKRNKVGDVVFTAITVWRFLNQDDDFHFYEGDRIFDIKVDPVGRVKVEEVKEKVLRKAN